MACVLLIEPDVKLARTYAAALRTRQHEVFTATTAQDAIFRADERQPDIVLLELQLVAHGGIEFLYEFRSYTDWQEVPVIVVSHVPPAEFEASKGLLYDRLGVRGYHYKPRLTLGSLLSVVDDTLVTTS